MAYVHRKYVDACKSERKESVSYRTFVDLWQTLEPQIIATKPRSDLYHTCQQNANLIIQAANDDQKESEAVKNALEHINIADTQRKHYKQSIEQASESLRKYKTNDTLDIGSGKKDTITGNYTTLTNQEVSFLKCQENALCLE